MALEEYQRKREFAKTPEPEGGATKESHPPRADIGPPRAENSPGANRFVVQKHQATRLHYDFRLELTENISGGDVVLKSWAVPKGPPEKKGEKRLAVAVEDHPVSYADFHGIIPEGQYGAGTVEIWDKGKFKLQSRGENLIEVELFGKKLKGNYALVQPKSFEMKHWLLIKK